MIKVIYTSNGLRERMNRLDYGNLYFFKNDHSMTIRIIGHQSRLIEINFNNKNWIRGQ